MQSILIDAGPLIALFNRSDQYHAKAVEFIKNFQGKLYSTWPVITETSHMLDFSTITQRNLLEWIQRGGISLFELEQHHVSRILELTRKFEDVPMDLADATLIVASESLNINKIASIDSDFYVYRNIRNDYLENIFHDP